MFHYFHRTREYCKRDVLALAIFTDDDANYLPKSYIYEFHNTRNIYEFDTFKLPFKTEGELTVEGNPFSIVMKTAKKTLEKQQKSDAQQLVWKTNLCKNS